ncbi:uncharacterized protein EV422DRAFT_538503 [Fimicolochytrium jonesii]|uniref:uncharacterized protein n=1 Tax=Fimicolochytrium jonesii TaxID=1396493 RepID=UPI0022FF457C|nr:uncharacterized protein EV422DRAFT_538503 [Fimicolochytrium jonesii]KAI8818410.1 hypothetical protein EV422DRAFT_538503 [Fimicolochytrium jonesii]
MLASNQAECALAPAQKVELLRNLEVELDLRRRQFEEETRRLEEDLILRCEEAWVSLPMELRQLAVGDFVTQYAGDVQIWKKKLFASKMKDFRAGKDRLESDYESDSNASVSQSEAMTFSQDLPQTPATSRAQQSTNTDTRDSLASVSTVSSRRMTLRSYTRKDATDTAPPTPRVAVPIRNGTMVCDFDPTQFESVEDMREELGEECDEALESIKAMHNQLSRLLGF